jgi:hypothetical protein
MQGAGERVLAPSQKQLTRRHKSLSQVRPTKTTLPHPSCTTTSVRGRGSISSPLTRARSPWVPWIRDWHACWAHEHAVRYASSGLLSQ